MFEQVDIHESEVKLKTNFESGLTNKEVLRRQRVNGKNILREDKKKNMINLFFSQLNDPMIYILLGAIIISILLKEISDAIIIAIVVVFNAVVGTVQEYKAEKALSALKKMTAPICVVVRENKIEEIKAEDLVVGDIVLLEAGKIVPADLRLIETNNMKVEESSLTGESSAVAKDSNVVLNKKCALGDKINLAFMSTNVVYGRGKGVVVATGMNTQIGKIAGMIDSEKSETTPLQKKLSDLGKVLGVITVAVCVLLFLIAVMQKRNVYEMLLNAISLAVAAIPEGLPAVVTIVLALGVQKMAKANAIVRKLPSVETLGAVTVVCSDKTGTLTQNKMKVEKMYCGGTVSDAHNIKGFEILVEGMALCNDSLINEKEIIGDPTEVALIELANNNGVDKKDLENKYRRINEVPFDSDRKMMTTLHNYKDGQRSYTKGAVDVVTMRCDKYLDNGELRKLDEDTKREILRVSHEMGKNALRVLALAFKEGKDLTEDKMVFVGLVGMIDPPREGTVKTVNTFKEAGITTVMITGDHKDTAYSIAKKIGIADNETQCMTGKEIDDISQEKLNERVKDLRVFARVSPEHKVKIVKAYKSNGEVVAMTGDGVNDAPSLKSADIGIAMGRVGTDVAKSAADMVLSDDDFSTIEKAVEEGRTIYDNIKKSVLFLLSSNLAEIITMVLAVIVGLPLPLIAVHVLWINLLTDSIPALALGSDVKKKDIMKEKPRNPQESLFAGGGIRRVILYGVIIGLLTLIAFITVPVIEMNSMGVKVNYSNILIYLSDPAILVKSQTYAFATLATSELLHAIGMRDENNSVVRKEFFDNKLMLVALVVGFTLLLMVVNVSWCNQILKTSALSVWEWLYVFGLGAITMAIHEFLTFVHSKTREVSHETE